MSVESEIVVSGISGRFPNANNMDEFSHKLYNKIDMTDEDESRWKHFHPEVPKRTGKIRNLEKFDATFFSILNKHANSMDPQLRCLLEHCYEAFHDAGISPQSLVGSNTGVFIGCNYSDSGDSFKHAKPSKEGWGLLGNANFYLANRLSYALGLCGPSMVVDTACSSSAYALDSAYQSIMSGACDAAIVGGSQLVLSLVMTVDYKRLRILAPDGAFCRPFDEEAAGFTRADTICVIFLQRKKDSKRVYAELLYTRANNDGYKEEGSTFPSRKMQQKLMEDFFKKSNIDTNLIDYVEAHSTGTRLGDPEEIAAIDEVYCKNKNRRKPLAVGSVKSNMGHAEASSAIASMAKIFLAFETQKIAPNINVTKIRDDIEAFAEKRIRVVTEVEDLTGNYISMNSFGLGGANVHALFKGNQKIKINHGIPADNLDRLVTWSGRTEAAVNTIFDDITKRPLDAEYIALLQNSQTVTNSANLHRGFGIFRHDENEKKAICLKRDIQNFNEGEKRKIVWVYSGIGSQWPGMCSDLMKIQVFADTINRCHSILLKKGVDLKKIINSSDKTLFDDVLNSYISIISIEIALTNVLKSLGLSPDFIIGHSVGEMGCAYADGCWTEEETILAAYNRGVASNESKSIDGLMAAIGLNYKDVEKSLPLTIDIACHNGIDSTTISGPRSDVMKYVNALKENNIFAKEVESSGNALHSRYITKMGENLIKRLKEVIKNPKERSAKWLSSSYPESMWTSRECQLSSAEYHTKNLLNPVLFEEVTDMLPKNAITIEIAPHALLKSILKRSLKDGIHLSVTQRGNMEGTHVIMESLGKLFQNGIDINLLQLYPAIDFPVSRGTPMISSNIKWNHDDNYYVPNFDTYNAYERRNMLINISDKAFEFVQGHIIDGKCLFPGTGWLHVVWETFGMMMGVHYSKIKVIFEDVKFLRATSLAKNQDVFVTVNIHRGSGRFEVIEGKSAISNGYIKIAENFSFTDISVEDKNDAVTLSEPDFYKEMRLRGYNHQGMFRAVRQMRDDGLEGKIKWNEEWTTFIDCLIQFQVLLRDTRMLILPTSVRKLIIDPIAHQKLIASKSHCDEILLDVKACPYMKIAQCGGIEIHGFEGSLVNQRRPLSDPVLEIYKFIPFECHENLSKVNIAKVCVQLLLENSPSKKLLSIELENDEILSESIFEALSDLPVISPEVNYLTSKEVQLENVKVHEAELSSFSDVNLIVKQNGIDDKEFIENAKTSLNENGCIISIEKSPKSHVDLDVIETFRTENNFIQMFKFKKPHETSKVIKITQNVGEWLEQLKDALNKNSSVIAYSQNDQLSGVVGLVNCIRREPNGDKLKCVFINDQSAPKFDPQNDFYKKQLDLGFATNVYQNKKWGTLRHLRIVEDREVKPRDVHCFANFLAKGDLSTLTWLYGPLNVNKSKEVINISYASLNFRDVMLATGKLTSDDVLDRIQQQCVFGFEFSGTLKGRKVMGMGVTGVMATHYDANAPLIWDVPKNWSLEEAATVPLVYFTVYLAFFGTIQIKKGKSILIHSGCGGVGLAAIQVAFAYGLEVYTTCSSEEKKNYLLSTYPKLKAENIGNSRDLSFERMISLNTKGKGVDYVLNSLSEEKLLASLRCLGMNGTFLEIGKFDILNKTKIDMGLCKNRINLKAVFFDDLPLKCEELALIHKLLNDDIKAGIIKPLKTNIYPASEIEQAFRFMASGKHIGKVLLKMREKPEDSFSVPISMVARVYCNSDETFLIVGGLGGFGLELADWLILRGCRKLVMSSSRGITNGYQAARIKLWKSYGVKVLVSTADITTESGCEQLIKSSNQLGPVGGIFNLAVALRDGIFENQTEQLFIESLAPKAEATKHLDKLSQKLCPSLKHFVIFSSVSCGRGNAGQSNYGMANSVMEKICVERNRKNLPAKAIQFGAIGDVGLLAAISEKKMDMEISGTLPQRITSCLEVLDKLLTIENEPVVATMVVAEKKQNDSKKGNIIEVIMSIMAIRDRKQLSVDANLSNLGMDSLMGVEILQILERDFDVVLSSQELRSLTLIQLEKLVTSKSGAALSAQATLKIEKLLTSFGDEKNSKEIILKLNSQKNGKKVLIIPGLEGMASSVWFEFGEKMKYPTFALQLATTFEEKSLEQIFDRVKNHIHELFKNESTFTIIAHSFGSQLALKTASYLESLGKSGKVLMIDGSPKFIHKLSNYFMPPNYTDDHVLDMLLMECSKLLFRDAALEIGKKVLSLKSSEEKLKSFMEFAKEKSEYSPEYGFNMLKGLFNRTKIMLDGDKIAYNKIKSPLTLFKPTESSIQGIDEDYGLSEFNEKVEVKTFDGDHISILSNLKLIEEILAIIQ